MSEEALVLAHSQFVFHPSMQNTVLMLPCYLSLENKKKAGSKKHHWQNRLYRLLMETICELLQKCGSGYVSGVCFAEVELPSLA